MTELTPTHLTPDDLDRWLAGELPPARLVHLDDCHDCFALAHAERRVVALIAALPVIAPHAGLADRVMAAVRVPLTPVRAPWRVLLHPSLLGPRWRIMAAASVVVAGGATVSAAWSLAHPDAFPAASAWVAGEASQWFWTTVRTLASNVTEQPWYGAARSLLGSPARAVLVSVFGVLLYASGIVAMRRLLTPAARGPRAQA
ncbi:MAG: anti-sigma factor family protein [Gemmatimonadales bacterium]